MALDNRSAFKTAFTVSIEAREGVTTGISAATGRGPSSPRLRTTRDRKIWFSPPCLSIRARRGGVLFRTGQTEGSVDLARLARLKPAGVICEVMNDDGTMARMPDLEKFSQKHGLKVVSIADIIAIG